MTRRFEYGVARIKDLAVECAVDAKGKVSVSRVLLEGRRLTPSNRFWNSLHVRFGFTSNIKPAGSKHFHN